MSANEDYKLVRVQPGDNLRSVSRASRVNALQNVSKSHVSGDQYVRTSGLLRAIGPGWVVNRKPRTVFKSGTVGTFPWRITVDTDGYVHVRPGTLNGMLPGNIFNPLGPLAGIGTVYVVLSVFTDGVQPTSALLELRNSPPEPPFHLVNIAPFSFEVLIGLTVNITPFNVVDGLLQAEPVNVLQTTIASPSPGQTPWELHWSWGVTQY